MAPKPLCVELFAGCFGWSAGWLELGGRSIGFDIEHLPHHGPVPSGSELVLQDVLTLHGSQFKDAELLLASPPCQEFSFMAMPFSRGKRIAAALRGQGEFPNGYRGSRTIPDLTRLFDVCFRIQREACEAAGKFIPLVVENVRGAQPWVGRSKYNYGSFHLFGDVPALMPSTGSRRLKSRISCAPRNFSERVANTPEEAHALHYRMPDETTKKEATGRKVPGMNFHEHEKTGKPGRSFQGAAVGSLGLTPEEREAQLVRIAEGIKVTGDDTFKTIGKPCGKLTDPRYPSGGIEAQKQPVWFNDDKRKCGGDWFGAGPDCSLMRSMSSKSSARKAASAQIAKIPLALSQWIAQVYYPR